MATIEITSENLDPTLSNNDIVILDFWASWCGPCKQFGPIFEAASQAHPDIVFGKVNTEEEQQLSAAAGISAIPTVMIFRETIPVFSHSGAIPKSALDDLIKQVKELDMEEVKKQAAAAEKASAHADQTATQND